jgi:hypothetical protein
MEFSTSTVNITQRDDYFESIDKEIREAKKNFEKVEDYIPATLLTLNLNTLYKINDVVKTPMGKLKIISVRFNLTGEIYKTERSLDFLSHKSNMADDKIKASDYKIQRTFDVYYKFETKDNSNLFYTEQQLIRYYETGIEPISVKKLLYEINKPQYKKRSIFKRLFSFFKK